MRVLDLFSGLGGWARPFRERGHEVVTVDIDPKFGCTYTADVFTWEPDGPFDIVLASPPCEGFTVMRIAKNWTRYTDIPSNAPKTETAWTALKLVQRTRVLIAQIQPAFFVIENPRAKLRKLPIVADLERRTVTYCQYGDTSMKPTDLWGGFPPSLELRPPCKNGAPCHDRAPRGANAGTQGKASAAIRAEIPYQLAYVVCLAAEHDLNAALPGSGMGQGRLFG